MYYIHKHAEGGVKNKKLILGLVPFGQRTLRGDSSYFSQ